MLYEETMMKACMVRNTTDCDESWDVMVMHCYGFNIAYLSPVEHCGRPLTLLTWYWHFKIDVEWLN
jgi:hypothetical protein